MTRNKKSYIKAKEVGETRGWEPPAMVDIAINQDSIDRLQRTKERVKRSQEERTKKVEKKEAEKRNISDFSSQLTKKFLNPNPQPKTAPQKLNLTPEQAAQVGAMFEKSQSESKKNKALDEKRKAESSEDKESEQTENEQVTIPQAELEQIKQQAYDEGFAKGIQDAKVQSEAAFSEEMEQLEKKKQMIELMIGALQNRASMVEEEVEVEVVALVQMIVRQIIKREIHLDPSHLIGVLRDAIQYLPMSINQQVVVDMSPQQAEIIAEALNVESDSGSWRIQANPTLQPGDMRITMGESGIDVSVERQINKLLSQTFGTRKFESAMNQDNELLNHDDELEESLTQQELIGERDSTNDSADNDLTQDPEDLSCANQAKEQNLPADSEAVSEKSIEETFAQNDFDLKDEPSRSDEAPKLHESRQQSEHPSTNNDS